MRECIILAGGFGTRLQSVVKDVPKCMAEVADKPFLSYLFDYAEEQKMEHIVLSLGYKSEVVLQWLENKKFPFKVSYVIEESPLGTGGAIKLAFSKIESNRSFVINGDTFFDVDTNIFFEFHQSQNATISVALKPMTDFDRYGSVELAENGRITCFNEKRYCENGLINGGVYIIEKNIFQQLALPEKFSFEKDIMESHIQDVFISGCEQNRYFIDIGIPSDFEKANYDFKSKI